MRILLLLNKGFELMEMSVFVDVFGWARNDYGCDVSVTTCGFSRTVVSTFGVPVIVDELIQDVSAADYDALAIPGGFEEFGFYNEAYDEQSLALIRLFNEQKKPIASICVAALPLGKSGILHGRKASTYHLDGGKRQGQLAEFGAVVVNEPVVVTDSIITSYCPQTAPHVAFRLLEMLAGESMANTVQRAMGW